MALFREGRRKHLGVLSEFAGCSHTARKAEHELQRMNRAIGIKIFGLTMREGRRPDLGLQVSVSVSRKEGVNERIRRHTHIVIQVIHSGRSAPADGASTTTSVGRGVCGLGS